MQSIQYVGPFDAGTSKQITLTAVYKILQIGIEHQHSIPIQEYENIEQVPKVTLVVDGKQFTVCDNDILEFQDLYQSTARINFPYGLDAYTIIDLAFKDIEEE